MLSVGPAAETKPAGRSLPSEWKAAFSRTQHLQRGHRSKASGSQPAEHREQAETANPEEREKQKHWENSADERINPDA